MTEMKRIVCLANSRKLSGRCIAGKEVEGGGWLRPVSTREHQEVSEYERQYEDGTDPDVLDVIDVPVARHAPGPHQPENWILDADHYWERIDQISWSDLDQYADTERRLWTNGSSTRDGENDRVTLAVAEGASGSLLLIHIANLSVDVLAPGKDFGNPKRRVKGEFEYDGISYRLSVTDPKIEHSYLRQPDGRYSLGDCYLTVSLGEPYGGYCYKLIAAVIARHKP